VCGQILNHMFLIILRPNWKIGDIFAIDIWLSDQAFHINSS
jgi:hypothetical protein